MPWSVCREDGSPPEIRCLWSSDHCLRYRIAVAAHLLMAHMMIRIGSAHDGGQK